jgi:hypothetical protein
MIIANQPINDLTPGLHNQTGNLHEGVEKAGGILNLQFKMD